MSIAGKSSPVAEAARNRAAKMPETGNPAVDEYHGLVAALQNEHDLTFTDAWNRVRNENPAKWKAYVESVNEPEPEEAKAGKKEKSERDGPPPKPMHCPENLRHKSK